MLCSLPKHGATPMMKGVMKDSSSDVSFMRTGRNWLARMEEASWDTAGSMMGYFTCLAA